MDEAFVTRCPKCKTAFKVNPNLLAKANGKVRCGACLCVFDAEDHIQFASDELENSAPAAQVVLNDEPVTNVIEKPAPKPASPKVEPTIAPKPAQPEPTLNAADPARAVRQEPTLGGEPQLGSSATFNDDFAANLAGDDDEEFVFQDDPDDLFDDDDATRAEQEEDKSGIGEIDEDFLNFEADDSMRNQFEPHSAGFTDADDDEAWAKELLQDNKKTPEPSGFSLVDSTFEAEDEPKTASVNVTQYVAPSVSPAATPARSKAAAVRVNKVKSNNEASGSSLAIDEIESHGQAGGGFFGTSMMALLSVVLVLVLAAQYGWRNKDELSQVSNLRPIYSTVCDLFNCTLPALTDVQLIQVTDDQVIVNPNDRGTVLVNIKQRNIANFEQPYPQVIVSFLNEQNRVTQRFRVNPQDYLTGSIRPTDLMPINVPVQVQLTLDNPGNVARYRIDLAPAQ